MVSEVPVYRFIVMNLIVMDELQPFGCFFIQWIVFFFVFFLVCREKHINVVVERTQQCSRLKCTPISCLDGSHWKPIVLLRGCRYCHSELNWPSVQDKIISLPW